MRIVRDLGQHRCQERVGHKNGLLSVKNISLIARTMGPLWNISPEGGGVGLTTAFPRNRKQDMVSSIRRCLGVHVSREVLDLSDSKSTWEVTIAHLSLSAQIEFGK